MTREERIAAAEKEAEQVWEAEKAEYERRVRNGFSGQ